MILKPINSEIRHPADLEACRQQLKQQFLRSRRLTLALFDGVDSEAFSRQAHADFSPLGWHLGHIGFTEELWLLKHCAGYAPICPSYHRLFAADGLPKDQRCHLPSLTEISSYLEQIREQVLDYLAIAPLAEQAWLWRWLLQHESQHVETICWVLQLQRQPSPWMGQLQLGGSAPVYRPTSSKMVCVQAGISEQGNNSLDALDNEKPAHAVELETFWLNQYPVTQGQYQAFIDAGGYSEARWWSPAGWRWLQDHPVAHPLYWLPNAGNHPVCGVSWYEADAYARFVGKRLPTEAEWEKAAAWNPLTLEQQRYPWGALEPTPQHCNHNYQHAHPRGTTPVDAYPLGQSPVGCYDMLGNIWEWTDTWFHAYDGFNAYPYPGYSQVYFDHQHRVLKGGSWATCAPALRSAFRNWYQPEARELFAGFRCAHS